MFCFGFTIVTGLVSVCLAFLGPFLNLRNESSLAREMFQVDLTLKQKKTI